MNTRERTTERLDQKRQTREKLLGAARALVKEGRTLTVAAAAQRAELAEATAYRYYRNPRSLLRDAFSIDWSDLDGLLTKLAETPDPADRAMHAAEEMARFVIAHETSIRLLFTSTEQEPRDLSDANGLPRSSFRRRLVEAILQGEEERLSVDFRRLQRALTVVISPYAVLALQDAMSLRPDEITEELGRMASRLFDRPKHGR